MRQTDTTPVQRFRTDRFFLVSGQWYFSTRENRDFGPFQNRSEAENKLIQYLETQSLMQYLRANDPVLEDAESSLEQVARLASDMVAGRDLVIA